MAGADEAKKVRTSSATATTTTTEWLELNDTEGTLKELEDFAAAPTSSLSPKLEAFLAHVAKTGDPVYSWDVLRPVVKAKVETVIEEFAQFSSVEEVPPYPNVDAFKFEFLKQFILDRVDAYQRGPPFTLQRICELLTEPMKHHKRIDKFMRALEKNLMVVSSGTCFGKPIFHEVAVNGEMEDSDEKTSEELSDGSSEESTSAEEGTKTETAPEEEEEKIIVDVETPATELEPVEKSVKEPPKVEEEPETESSDEPEAKKRKLELPSDEIMESSTPAESEEVQAESVDAESVEGPKNIEGASVGGEDQSSTEVQEDEPMDESEASVPVPVEEERDVEMDQDEVLSAPAATEEIQESSEPAPAEPEVQVDPLSETPSIVEIPSETPPVEESMEVEPGGVIETAEKPSEEQPATAPAEPEVVKTSQDSTEEAVDGVKEPEDSSDAKDDLENAEQSAPSVRSEVVDDETTEASEKSETDDEEPPLVNGSPIDDGNEAPMKDCETLDKLAASLLPLADS